MKSKSSWKCSMMSMSSWKADSYSFSPRTNTEDFRVKFSLNQINFSFSHLKHALRKWCLRTPFPLCNFQLPCTSYIGFLGRPIFVLGIGLFSRRSGLFCRGNVGALRLFQTTQFAIFRNVPCAVAYCSLHRIDRSSTSGGAKQFSTVTKTCKSSGSPVTAQTCPHQKIEFTWGYVLAFRNKFEVFMVMQQRQKIRILVRGATNASASAA